MSARDSTEIRLEDVEKGVMMRSKLALVSVLTVVALAHTSGAFAADFTPGSSGLGDPFFPLGGNGGYDVGHYKLTLAYDPPSNQLTGTVEIAARATQNLSQFDLDFAASRSPGSRSTAPQQGSHVMAKSWSSPPPAAYPPGGRSRSPSGTRARRPS